MARARSVTFGRARAFTLIETSLALVIIGVGVIAFVEAHNSFVRNNAWSSQAATANLLANEIRELTRRLPRHDPVTGLFIEGTGNSRTLHGWGLESGESVPADFDDVDDLDGQRFGEDGTMPGPIDALGELVPVIDADGIPVVDAEGNRVAMAGWSQSVTVEKVDPFNTATARDHDFSEEASGSFPGRDVDAYPLRVTVVVEYRGPYDANPAEVTRVTWIVP